MTNTDAMTTIRICEKSEARLLIDKGGLKDYVNLWSESFPQKELFPFMRELHSKYELKLLDSRLLAYSMGADDGIILELGNDVLVKKINNKVEVYRRISDKWVMVDGDLSLFDSDELFSDDPIKVHTFNLCDEGRILKAKSMTALAKSVRERINRWWSVNHLFSVGDHEIWKLLTGNRIQVFSNVPDNRSIYNSEEEMAGHLEKYRKAHKPAFGPF